MLILHIETATGVCAAALSDGSKLLARRTVNEANVHAEKLTLFCEEIMRETGVQFSQLNAVCVSKGPGSYTGLRIGVSAAKGFCYALNIPLLAVNTLEALAYGMKAEAEPGTLLCPMLDARRMEVYYAVYNDKLEEVQPTEPLVVEENSFAALLEKQPVLFAGDGMPKCRTILEAYTNARFSTVLPAAEHLIEPALKKLAAGDTEDIAWFEPFYLKTFQPGPMRSSGGGGA
ncbi:MAG: tRNA (adenosine(37)-N6)-threonylcarbamoyltransferase complex dimerization subunit type 1 TsaB [Bacteroidia bacterium]|jgi:tRNA threonylcarbamoyladenosine biosynthesis protein TsaB|nr:tRNA (adenosine(37)-N6)-threonylcarbamoyltransferase complex dimerization subunit type 1 TsaB [Bacteroidia bacterium]